MDLLPRSRDVQRMRQRCKTFTNLVTVEAFSKLIRIPVSDLQHLASNGKYRTFTVAKKDGGERLIETPEFQLKKVLDHINRFLSACYYFQRTPPAYGFVVNGKNDRDRRNIVTNARRHLKKTYLLNIDLKNFFHTVSAVMIQDIYLQPPFRFEHELALLLTQLTTHNNRLPMGSPTSPVLSNFACRQFDHTLLHYAKANKCYFTRYADDLSFSSMEAIEETHIEAIKRIVVQYGFTVNDKKIKLYKENDMKEVTGLILTDRVSLPNHFIPELEKEITELAKVVRIQNKHGELYTEWVDNFKLRIKGKLNFIAYINGKQDEKYKALNQSFREASVPPASEFGAYSWFDFTYKV